jgi:hypothetical protein
MIMMLFAFREAAALSLALAVPSTHHLLSPHTQDVTGFMTFFTVAALVSIASAPIFCHSFPIVTHQAAIVLLVRISSPPTSYGTSTLVTRILRVPERTHIAGLGTILGQISNKGLPFSLRPHYAGAVEK